jgi:hypothetical protein
VCARSGLGTCTDTIVAPAVANIPTKVAGDAPEGVTKASAPFNPVSDVAVMTRTAVETPVAPFGGDTSVAILSSATAEQGATGAIEPPPQPPSTVKHAVRSDIFAWLLRIFEHVAPPVGVAESVITLA